MEKIKNLFFIEMGIVTAILTLLGYLFGIYKALWAIPIAFLAIGLMLLLLWVTSCFVCTRFIDINKECNKYNKIYGYYTNCIIDIVVWFLRIKTHITGEEKLPEEKFLLVCNHRGAMDPLITMGVLRRYNMGFVAKKELFEIPVISRLMHQNYCLSLNRGDVKDSAKVILRAGQIVKEGQASMGIYPEGKRNREEGLLPFMHGAFKIAKKADCSIVVATIKNTEHIMKNKPWKRTHVYLDFIGVIDKEIVRENTTVQLSDIAKEMMEKKLG